MFAEIACWAYLSMNRNQASRKGFAGQQNNPLFFKYSKRCLVVLGRNNPSLYTVNGRPLYVHLNGLAIVLLK